MGVREPTRVYRHAIFDSGRWAGFEPRSDDIVIATSMKAGTTWMQGIVWSLLWPSGNAPGPVGGLSHWLDFRVVPPDAIHPMLEAQEHRRFIKTHTPADGVPFNDDISYIVVGRDGRDVFMSMLNHWEKFRPEMIDFLNADAGPEVADFPAWDGEIHKWFDVFVSRGSFPWEGDGAPWWSHLNHCKTWWELEDRPNVLFVHYNDLLADLSGEMRRIAEFLDVNVAEELWDEAVGRCRIDEMREAATKAGFHELGFIGGAESFFFKGNNGRWRGVLTDAELDRWEARVAAVLSPEAAHWLEHGRLAAPATS